MRIGIITIHNSPNYGACLQSYALWKYIEQKGHHCEIIDLYRPYQKEYVPSVKYIAPGARRSDLFSVMERRVKSLFKHEKGLFNHDAKKKFDVFNSEITLSKAYKGIDELYENPPMYDVYISGSDQLWNPTQPYCLEPYFLTFAPKDAKKISYATSIGVTEISDKDKHNFLMWLQSYKSISVREKQAKELLSTFVDKEITIAADPTFLLDASAWKNMAVKPVSQRPYILLFTLSFQQDMVNYCLKLSKEADMDLIVLNQIQPEANGNYIAIEDAGPKEFLGYIEGADMVITDSFHCTVFSIILGAKSFYTIIKQDNKRGSRITDILSIYKINNHLLHPSMVSDYKELKANAIDRDVILKTMTKEQNFARNFLDRELQ